MQARVVYQLPGAKITDAARLFVDTNVWKCLTYTKATIKYTGKANIYATFIANAVKHNAALFTSALCYPELAHIIEATECDIYNTLAGTAITLKKFREGTAERESVVRKFSVRMRPHVARDLMCGFMILCAHDSIVKR
jgi:tellurite resistance-related uncharacterized protein